VSVPDDESLKRFIDVALERCVTSGEAVNTTTTVVAD
jgi:hypothetical protein